MKLDLSIKHSSQTYSATVDHDVPFNCAILNGNDPTSLILVQVTPGDYTEILIDEVLKTGTIKEINLFLDEEKNGWCTTPITFQLSQN